MVPRLERKANTPSVYALPSRRYRPVIPKRLAVYLSSYLLFLCLSFSLSLSLCHVYMHAYIHLCDVYMYMHICIYTRSQESSAIPT